jgi:hypothetical protein
MIVYDRPFEISRQQYKYLRKAFAGIAAFRKTFDWRQFRWRYYTKVWLMKYAPYIQSYLESTSVNQDAMIESKFLNPKK